MSQRFQNFLDNLRVYHDLLDRKFFPVLGCLGGFDERFAILAQLQFEFIGYRLQALLDRIIKFIEKLKSFEIVLLEQSHYSALVIAQELRLILHQNLLLEHRQKFSIKIGPAEAFI